MKARGRGRSETWSVRGGEIRPPKGQKKVGRQKVIADFLVSPFTTPGNMKVGKPKSKRVPVRLRHKIEKASAAKQRKQRKEAKKNPQWRSRVKKDPGIPNLFPYKAEMLAEMEELKHRKAEEQMRKRELAKAQRQGLVGLVGDKARDADEDTDEQARDAAITPMDEDDAVVALDENPDSSNPMAALLASASARANAGPAAADEQEDTDDDNEWEGIEEVTSAPVGKDGVLPRRVLQDPIRTFTTLINRMQKTPDGIERMMQHYQTRPLVTAGSDVATSLLVEVARKRGRLGKGGVPNLHSAALTVLCDVNDGRLVLPAVQATATVTASVASSNKGEVRVVSQMAEPFRIAGLWGG